MQIRRSASSTSDYLEIPLPFGREAHVRIAHEDATVTAELRHADYRRSVRVSIGRCYTLAFGAGLTLEDDCEKQVHGSVYLGRLAVYASVKDSRIGRAIEHLVGRHARRRTNIELSRFDDGTCTGPETRLSGHLWDDDSVWEDGKSRTWSANLTHLLWGRPQISEPEVLEERAVVVALPEGQYRMQACLLRRTIRWPRWPLAKFHDVVEFKPACMLVPRRKSDNLSYEGSGPGCRVCVEAPTIISGIAALVRQVLRAREHYGRRDWTPRPTPHRHESHQVSLWALGAKDPAAVADLFHGASMWITAGAELALALDNPPPGAILLSRNPVVGGVVVTRAHVSPRVEVDGAPVEVSAPIWPQSRVRLGDHEVEIHYSPIGPPPPATQLELVADPPDPVAADVAAVLATLDKSQPSPSESENVPFHVSQIARDAPLIDEILGPFEGSDP